MENLYAVIDKSTGKPKFRKAYMSARDAKLALKNRISRSGWAKYAVASVKFEPTVIATVDDNGNWTEVPAE